MGFVSVSEETENKLRAELKSALERIAELEGEIKNLNSFNTQFTRADKRSWGDLFNQNTVLTEQVKIMRESLKYVGRVSYGTELSNTKVENNEILARHYFNSSDKAREALAACDSLTKEQGE
jgi:gamma-glutamyl phosphate reductase